eukprot:5258954-Amphidinium_carterae.1
MCICLVGGSGRANIGNAAKMPKKWNLHPCKQNSTCVVLSRICKVSYSFAYKWSGHRLTNGRPEEDMYEAHLHARAPHDSVIVNYLTCKRPPDDERTFTR